ncbi:hypothetical protein F183_A24990 [Bryobacterales bacterium F-183]|nr:hypothetical protein F183_A24990 [Bryobacterales bacterium F-183]
MTITATVAENGDLRIPESIREQLHLEPGTTVTIQVQDRSDLRTQVAGNESWRRLRGMGRNGPSLTLALEEERRAERERDERS